MSGDRLRAIGDRLGRTGGRAQIIYSAPPASAGNRETITSGSAGGCAEGTSCDRHLAARSIYPLDQQAPPLRRGYGWLPGHREAVIKWAIIARLIPLGPDIGARS